ncbi:hypothetical protein Avbf_08919 [Armadillidium vulgare]|nr:hypothetical protein Avbf_08919 [Armadillidium vulgare]
MNQIVHCVSDFDAGSQTDLSLSSKPRPVNMVVPTPVPNTTCPTNLSNSLSDLPLNSEIDTNHNTSLTNNNNNNPMTSVGSNSLSKYIMNFSISPLKTSFESMNSRSEHQQSQQNISKFSNNSVLENEPFNTNVENQSTCSDYQQVQLYPSSVSASPAQCDMPFLMATPTKNSNISAVSSQPCVLSGTNFPASHLESNTNQRPSSTFSKTVVRDLFSPKTTSPLNTDADTQFVENNIEVSQESMSINTTNKNNSGTQEAHEPISSINMPDNNEPDKNIDTNDITTSSLINTDTDKCFENEIESNIDKSRDDMASGKDEEQNDLSFEMNYFDKVKHILGGSFNKFMDLFSLFVHGKKTPKFIYPKICKMIKDHPDLQNEFLVFFNAEQAKKLGKESEHRIVLCAKHLYENKRSPELIDKEEVIQVLKSVMNHPNISESQLAYLLKPIITLHFSYNACLAIFTECSYLYVIYHFDFSTLS